MSHDEIVNLFLIELEKDEECSCKKRKIKKGCFDIEFGYYDLNIGHSYTETDFVKMWKIRPSTEKYPVIYINDSTSNVFSYFNGIMIFED